MSTEPSPARSDDAIKNHALLFDTPTQAVIATTASGSIAYWNHRAQEVYGWRAEEVLGKNVVEVTPAVHAQDDAAAIMERLRAGLSWSGEFQVRHRDGSELKVFVQDFPVRNAQGELVGIIGVSKPAE
ncbi:MAG: PAS domain S-box protein [Gemmatimonadetes bacterium]|nr:PAS domain S-box protein [Gemmatimonadota bacterium]